MQFEVFHRGLLGRPDIVAVDMIHYPGLWGLCFTHHPPHNNHPRYAADTTTAGVLRFIEDAYHGREALALDALTNHTITTHHVDADAVLPVWALLHPEEALARRAQLEQIARCGDFFLYLDDASAKVNATIEELHRQLRGSGVRGERLVDRELTVACFSRLLPELGALLEKPDRGRAFWEAPLRLLETDVAYLMRPGRVSEFWEQHTSVVEIDHAPEVHALNTVCRNDLLLIWRTDILGRRIEVRPAIAWYELPSMPNRPQYDLSALAVKLNLAEQAAQGTECAWKYKAGPVTLQASHSVLSQETVLEQMRLWLAEEPEDRLPASYRADVQKVFRYQEKHAVFACHRRFAAADTLHYTPGAHYEGLHLLTAGLTSEPVRRAKSLEFAPGKSPIGFAVSDDFYWNRALPEPLEISVTYVDHDAGAFWVEVDTWGNPVHSLPAIRLCGDGQEKTQTFAIADARLGASQEDGADLRLMRTPGTPITLKRFTVSKARGEARFPEPRSIGAEVRSLP